MLLKFKAIAKAKGIHYNVKFEKKDQNVSFSQQKGEGAKDNSIDGSKNKFDVQSADVINSR